MKGTLPACTPFLTALLAAGAASADEVYLKSGGQLSGRVVSRSATTIEVEVGAGKIGVPVASVLRIEEGRSALQEYEERAGRLAARDVEGWLALGEWASARGLGTQASGAYHRALAAAPDDPRPNAALGNVQVEGRWVSEEEGYRAKGYLFYEGEWITPAEHAAILRDSAAETERARELRQAEARVREAEARSQEAEARAREAEAQQPTGGIPLWYGWAAGPTAWPTGPVIAPPVAPARPVARPKPVSR